MNILLTGYKGFIGQNFLKKLKGHNLLLHEWGDDLPSFQNLDWVIHLGANSSTVETDYELIVCQNLFSSIRILEECIANNVNLQYSSSASVYGKTNHFSEDGPCSPLNYYAISKYLFEKYAESRNVSNIIVQGFRYFNVYGPHEEHKEKQASPFTQFRKQAEENGEIVLWRGSEEYLRDFIHVDEICDYHLKFFDIQESGVWNLGTGKPRSFYSIAWEIFKETNCKIKFIDMPEHIKPHYQAYTCANLKKLNKTLEKYKCNN